MLGFSTGDSLPPQAKRSRLHLRSHYIDHSRFVDPKTEFNRVERGSVFPCHFDNTLQLINIKWHARFHYSFQPIYLVVVDTCYFGFCIIAQQSNNCHKMAYTLRRKLAAARIKIQDRRLKGKL